MGRNMVRLYRSGETSGYPQPSGALHHSRMSRSGKAEVGDKARNPESATGRKSAILNWTRIKGERALVPSVWLCIVINFRLPRRWIIITEGGVSYYYPTELRYWGA